MIEFPTCWWLLKFQFIYFLTSTERSGRESLHMLRFWHICFALFIFNSSNEPFVLLTHAYTYTIAYTFDDIYKKGFFFFFVLYSYKCRSGRDTFTLVELSRPPSQTRFINLLRQSKHPILYLGHYFIYYRYILNTKSAFHQHNGTSVSKGQFLTRHSTI